MKFKNRELGQIVQLQEKDNLANSKQYIMTTLPDDPEITDMEKVGTPLSAENLNKGNWRDDPSLSFRTLAAGEAEPEVDASKTQIYTKPNGDIWVLPPDGNKFQLNSDKSDGLDALVVKKILNMSYPIGSSLVNFAEDDFNRPPQVGDVCSVLVNVYSTTAGTEKDNGLYQYLIKCVSARPSTISFQAISYVKISATDINTTASVISTTVDTIPSSMSTSATLAKEAKMGQILISTVVNNNTGAAWLIIGTITGIITDQIYITGIVSTKINNPSSGSGEGSGGLKLTYDIGMPGQTITYTAAELAQYKVIEASSLSSDQAQQMTVTYYSAEDPDTQTDVDCICIKIYILPMGGTVGFGFISTIATGTNITTHTYVDYNLNNTHPITFTGTNTTPFFIAKYK